MTHRTPALAPHPARPPAARVTLALLGLLVVSGCARMGSEGMAGGVSAAPNVAAASTDPLVVFASRARPGAQERVVMADGQSAQVRLVRSYNAASGRECRELMVGSGMIERPRLVCATGNGGWAEARPLLRGGGAGRP
ncbi:DVU3141 family protein [Falsiroseomonas sp. HC035]|uniref:DVU3141 family protein n=1 Tax=Falsiroseomonas sp. HC035 TaxID=3390999 RepID=UPI003D31B03B